MHALYSTEGFRGLLKETATARKAAISKTYETFGGTVDSFYLTEENAEIVMIVQVPDTSGAVDAAALTLAVSASGSFASLKVTRLYSVEEIDQAIKKTVSWRPPGR